MLVDSVSGVMVSVTTGGPEIKTVDEGYKRELRAALKRLQIPYPNNYDDLWRRHGRWSQGDMPKYSDRRTYIADLMEPRIAPDGSRLGGGRPCRISACAGQIPLIVVPCSSAHSANDARRGNIPVRLSQAAKNHERAYRRRYSGFRLALREPPAPGRFHSVSIGPSARARVVLVARRMGLRGHSSAGRAPALQAGGRRFDPGWLHFTGHKRPCANHALRASGYKKEPPASVAASVIMARSLPP
jgi:hypothetical protein